MGLVSWGLQAQGEMGLSKHGELTNSTVLKLDKNGGTNSSDFLSKNGQSILYSAVLNYSVFSNTGISNYATDAADFDRFTLIGNRTSQGTYDATKLLDWVGYTNLPGITMPNLGDYFAMEVSGYFIPTESGTYTFTCEGDDAVDLFINEVNVAYHYNYHGVGALGTHQGTIDLMAGEKYSFRARMQETGGGEGLKVYWKRPSEINNTGWKIYPSELSAN